MSDYRTYLKTLRRVPKSIVLAVATRDIEPLQADCCLCGWFVREQIARMAGQTADEQDVYYGTVVPSCVDSFGGSDVEWWALFDGIYQEPAADIERAFVERVLECVP